MDKIRKYIFISLLLMMSAATLSAQSEEPQDSLIRLLSANKARLVEQNGRNFRKVIGSVVFFHNNTYLYCDSAYWNVDDRYIDAIGNVVIEQEKTTLVGDSLKYVIDENTAKFRGHLVELQDDEGNILRTTHLDYNTKDSVASFYNGAAMKDKDGNVIESFRGRYDSKVDEFHFYDNVEMFSDSLFCISDYLRYNSLSDVAYLEGNMKGWYDSNALSSDEGTYDRANEKLFFRGGVHGLTEDYELWSDSLYYDRYDEFSHMLGNVQLTDTVHNTMALCGELKFWNEPRRSELYREPVLVMMEENAEGGVDSTFIGADTLYYYTKRMFEVDSAEVALAKERYEMAQMDPLADKSQSNQSGQAGQSGQQNQQTRQDGQMPPADSTGMAADSLAVTDSLSAVADSLAVMPPPPDTTTVSFMAAYRNVKIYREGIQAVCDSLLFTTLDSLARMFKSPVIWYEEKNQITADSMQFLLKDNELDKGLLLSNSFVISEEVPSKYYHQIKSPEMIGYFAGSAISRFDAMGGVNLIFFLAEEGDVSTVNKKETRLMSARLKDGEVQRIKYIGNTKSDAFPLFDLKTDDMYLKGFDWKPDLRPADRFAVTDKGVRESRRRQYMPSFDFPAFRYSEVYFEGYMKGVMEEIRNRKPLVWIDGVR